MNPSGTTPAFISSNRLSLNSLLGSKNRRDRKSTRLNSSHSQISYAVFCLKKKNAPSPVPGTTDRPGREIEEAFYMAFRASPVAIVITDLRNGRFLEVNDQFLRLFGFAPGDVLGHPSVDLGIGADIERREDVRGRLP